VTSRVDGDEEFMRLLYAGYYRPLSAYVSRLVQGDGRAAEDIVQETLLRAWRHADALEPDSAGPWLYTVAHNLAVSQYYRRPQHRAEVPMHDASLPVVGDEVDRVLDGWVVTEALRALSVDHRAVLVQMYYRRRSVADAARILDVPAGTVKSRCFYALKALRQALEERGVTW
jgi:RNA polymerase sigma-70 factor (ECF subfamily)